MRLIIATAILAATACTPEQQAAVRAHLEARAACDVECMIRERWAGTGHADRAVAIAHCESGLQAWPEDEKSYKGVFQMGVPEWRRFGHGRDVHDAWSNIDGAFEYWSLSGWQPWSCRAAA